MPTDTQTLPEQSGTAAGREGANEEGGFTETDVEDTLVKEEEEEEPETEEPPAETTSDNQFVTVTQDPPEKVLNKAPSLDDLKTLDERSLVSEVNLAAPRQLATSMSGNIEEYGDKEEVVVLGEANNKGEEELRKLVSEHQKKLDLSTSAVSKISSNDGPKFRNIPERKMKRLQSQAQKLKEIDPDYLKTLNRHNDSVDVR